MLPASPNGAAAPAPPRVDPPPSAYKALKRIFGEINTLMASIEAPYEPDSGGWGGLVAVWDRLSETERTDVAKGLADALDMRD